MDKMLKNKVFEYLNLEVKLIYRNKKPRENFYQMLIVYAVLFPIILYSQNHTNETLGSIGFSILFMLSGLGSVFIFLHGVYLLTWESTYFEGLNIQDIDMKDYFTAKFYLFILSALLLYVLSSIIFIFIDSHLIFPLLAITFFNVGVGSFFILIFALFNNERAYLEKSIFLNNEGYGMWQYFFMMFVILLPCLSIQFLDMIFTQNISFIMLALIGVSAILTSNLWLKIVFHIYEKRKYKILEKFTEVL